MDESLYWKFLEVERSHWWFVARRQILLALFRHYLPRGGRILDVGCATGYFIEGAQQEFDAWGIDPSPVAVKICQDRGLTQVVPGSTEDFAAVQDKRFDAVGFFDVIEHVDDDLSALTNARAVLADRGLVMITVPAYMWLWSEHDVLNEHKRRYVREEVAALVQRAGFEIEQLTYFNSYLFPSAVLARLARRVIRSVGKADLSMPPPWANRLMTRVFASERRRLVPNGRPRGFPAGLSLLAIARKAGA
ncbi:MAG TPA: class I SAM-dependent methyltransferase [Gemmatimonadales bacterium]|nr:class I SAM-dependent methyltransferase [Gemmatimonadales bacterium]